MFIKFIYHYSFFFACSLLYSICACRWHSLPGSDWSFFPFFHCHHLLKDFFLHISAVFDRKMKGNYSTWWLLLLYVLILNVLIFFCNTNTHSITLVDVFCESQIYREKIFCQFPFRQWFFLLLSRHRDPKEQSYLWDEKRWHRMNWLKEIPIRCFFAGNALMLRTHQRMNWSARLKRKKLFCDCLRLAVFSQQ